MTCDTFTSEDFLVAATDFDSAENELLRAHLADGCPLCAGRMAEAGAVVTHLAMTLPPVQPAEGLKTRLRRGLDLASSGSPAVSTRDTSRTGSPRRLLLYGPLTAAAALLIISIALLNQAFKQRRIDHNRVVAMGKLRVRSALWKKRATLREAKLLRVEMLWHVLNGSHVMLASLKSKVRPKASGMVVVNASMKKCVFSARRMSPLPAGMVYEVWLITAKSRKIPAGTFKVNRRGAARMVMPMTHSMATVADFAVTMEPSPGTKQPTGKIQLLGNFIKE